jgi:hypothetical protein
VYMVQGYISRLCTFHVQRCEAADLEEQYAVKLGAGRRRPRDGQGGGVLDSDVEDGDGRAGEGRRRPC